MTAAGVTDPESATCEQVGDVTECMAAGCVAELDKAAEDYQEKLAQVMAMVQGTAYMFPDCLVFPDCFSHCRTLPVEGYISAGGGVLDAAMCINSRNMQTCVKDKCLLRADYATSMEFLTYQYVSGSCSGGIVQCFETCKGTAGLTNPAQTATCKQYQEVATCVGAECFSMELYQTQTKVAQYAPSDCVLDFTFREDDTLGDGGANKNKATGVVAALVGIIAMAASL
jgi:hypothetical protein